LVACYFACSDHADKDGTVWIYEMCDKILTDENTLDSLMERKGVFGYLPKAAFPRIINQRGLFTVHCDAPHPLEVSESRVTKKYPNLIRVDIPAALKADIVTQLGDYGIDQSYLFPGLDGLSTHINAATSRMRKPDRDK